MAFHLRVLRYTTDHAVFPAATNKKIGIVREKLPLINQNGEELLYCAKCYDSIPKEEKLKLTSIKKKTGSEFNVGYAFGLMGGLGYADSQNESIMKPIKQYNLTLDRIDYYSIMNFNRHFLLCGNDLKAGIMGKMGKVLKTEKLNELAKQHHFQEFEMLDKRDQKAVKKELKVILKKNMKSNKHLKNLKTFLQSEGSQ